MLPLSAWISELMGRKRFYMLCVALFTCSSFLCGLAGGGGVNSLAGLQSLLSSLGVNLTPTQLQNLLTQLGIGDLSGGLTQLDNLTIPFVFRTSSSD